MGFTYFLEMPAEVLAAFGPGMTCEQSYKAIAPYYSKDAMALHDQEAYNAFILPFTRWPDTLGRILRGEAGTDPELRTSGDPEVSVIGANLVHLIAETLKPMAASDIAPFVEDQGKIFAVELWFFEKLRAFFLEVAMRGRAVVVISELGRDPGIVDLMTARVEELRHAELHFPT